MNIHASITALVRLQSLRRLPGVIPTMVPEKIEATRAIMLSLFGRPRTLEAVASELHVSRERVRQIERDALRHLGQRLIEEFQP